MKSMRRKLQDNTVLRVRNTGAVLLASGSMPGNAQTGMLNNRIGLVVRSKGQRMDIQQAHYAAPGKPFQFTGSVPCDLMEG